MRIGFFTPSWPGERVANGITTTTAGVVDGLRALGHEVFILTLEKEDVDHFARQLPPPSPLGLFDRVRTRFGAVVPYYKNFADLLAAGVNQLVSDKGIDIFIMEESFGWAGFVQEAVSIPVCMVLHGPHFLLEKAAPLQHNAPFNRDREACEGKALMKCAALTAPSKSTMDQTISHYGAAVETRAVFPNPMRVKPPVNDAAFHESVPFKILFVGRFDFLKGGDVAIDAFALLAQRRDDVTLTFAGPDNGIALPDGGEQKITDKLAQLPADVRERITYLGAQTKSQIDVLRRDHPCAIVPSRFENFSNTLLEAMACGSAVIASDVGGLPEVATDNETGLLFPPGDAPALAAALERLAGDRDLARRLGAAARIHIEMNLAPKKIAADFAAFLQPVVGAYNPRD